MNKYISLIIIIFLIYNLFLFTVLIILSLLGLFVAIPNRKLFSQLYSNNNLDWFDENGKYKSIPERRKTSKNRLKVIIEAEKSGKITIKKKKLFHFILKIRPLSDILLKVLLINFLICLFSFIIIFLIGK